MTTACVVSEPRVSPQLYRAWLAGAGVKEAASELQAEKDYADLSAAQAAALAASQYALFESLAAPFLRRPHYFAAQGVHAPVQPRSFRAEMVRAFFALEPRVAAALVPRRLVPRTRRELPALADECGVPAAVAVRVFENMVEVQGALATAFASAAVQRRPPEDAAVVAAFASSAIAAAYMLPDSLASDYAAALFLNHHAVAVPAGTPWPALLRVGSAMLSSWTAGTISFALDARIAQDAHDALEALRDLGEDGLAASLPSSARPRAPLVHGLLSTVLSLGAGLSAARSVSAMLSDVQTRVLRPARPLAGAALSALLTDAREGVAAAAMAVSSRPLGHLIAPIAVCCEVLPVL